MVTLHGNCLVETIGRSRARRSAAPGKVAITLRLDPAQVRKLQEIAAAENRSLTNYVETALLRDLAARSETARVIKLYAAPGTSAKIDPQDIIRGDGESDTAYAKRQDVLTELWSLSDDG